MSVQKYKSAQSSTENPRQTEYRLFADITRALMACRGKEQHDASFYHAVDWNRRLWLTLQMDAASQENKLADALKAQIISLAIWVDKHSSRVLRGDANVEALIDVNRTVMEGLASAPDVRPIPLEAPAGGRVPLASTTA